jgi:CheY-like chemotaxis protein
VTVDHTEDPDLVLADVSRVDPQDVAERYPDIPIVGFTNHTDTAGLRAANAAGFDQVLAKSALDERISTVVSELVASLE